MIEGGHAGADFGNLGQVEIDETKSGRFAHIEQQLSLFQAGFLALKVLYLGLKFCLLLKQSLSLFLILPEARCSR